MIVLVVSIKTLIKYSIWHIGVFPFSIIIFFKFLKFLSIACALLVRGALIVKSSV